MTLDRRSFAAALGALSQVADQSTAQFLTAYMARFASFTSRLVGA